MEIGVSPLCTVAGVTSTGLKLPAFLTFTKKSMPLPMSSRLPPLASEAAHTPLNAAAACVGLPLSATWPLYCGSSSALNVVGQILTFCGVAADRDEAAVVVVPVPSGSFWLSGMSSQVATWYGREQVLRGGLQGEAGADVEDVGSAVLPLLAGDGVELVLAGAVRVGAVDLDAVLLREGRQHLAVVGPVRGQRDDVERALGLARP